MKNKRLFIFAAYDKDGIIDDTLIWYLNALSGFGDIILFMDNEVKDASKLKNIKNLVYFKASCHHEYDFGSYKRAYMWAYDKKILNKYDWVYLVNDSVYGPFWDLTKMFNDLESRNVDMVGLFENFNTYIPKHIQSWFVGITSRLAQEGFIKEFINSVRPQQDKQLIVMKYEVRLSQLVLQNGYKYSAFYTHGQNGENACTMYENPLSVLESGIPFVKKSALLKNRKLMFMLPFTSEENIQMIVNHAERNGICTEVALSPEKYEKIYRFTIFSIPILTIYKKSNNSVSYKIYILDKIPIAKIVFNRSFVVK